MDPPTFKQSLDRNQPPEGLGARLPAPGRGYKIADTILISRNIYGAPLFAKDS